MCRYGEGECVSDGKCYEGAVGVCECVCMRERVCVCVCVICLIITRHRTGSNGCSGFIFASFQVSSHFKLVHLHYSFTD